MGKQSPEQGRPRAFVIKMLHFQDVVKILTASREMKEHWHGNSRIMIFLDRSPTLHKKVMSFALLKRLLRQAGLAYIVHYSTILRIELKSGGMRAFDCKGGGGVYEKGVC